MTENTGHISDDELVLAADGELKEYRAAQIREHLKACWKCRTRMAQIESAVVDFVEAIQSDGPDLPPIAGPRALLRARLAALPTAPVYGRGWRRLFAPGAPAYALAAVVLIAAIAGVQLLRREVSSHMSGGSVNVLQAGVLPNPAFTPGVTRPVSLAEVCSSGRAEVIRRVSRQEQTKVFAEYGIANAPAQDYEVDYLITPDLGGADDLRNLWPEPHRDPLWSSYAKDQLEDRLHGLVCSGKLSLAAAQRELSNNWIQAYGRYVQRGLPASQVTEP